MIYVIGFLIFIVFEYLFFGLMAKYQGYKCNHDCNKCKCWSCTHGTIYQEKGFFPVKDWSKWCLKNK